MGLFDRIFPKKYQFVVQGGKWETITAYSPVFTSRRGEAYEMELVRTSIDARSRHIGKLSIAIQGSANKILTTRLKVSPNQFMTWYKFLYRVNTILDMQNTCFIVPIYNDWLEPIGIYPILPSRTEIVEYKEEAWIRYEFASGKKASMPLSEVGILTKFQYMDEVYGSSPDALNDTLDLIHLQKQGLKEAIKNGATYRFMAQSSNFSKDSDLAKERKRFNNENFAGDENGGAFLLLPNTWTNIKQIDQKSFTVNKDEMNLIQTNIYNYFGVNEAILQNKALGDELDAFFNGAIEPFSIQFSEVLTQMLYTDNERFRGNKILLTANRLQYMSTDKKVQMVQQMGDRGMISINEARELFNYPTLPEDIGNKHPIRGEYYFIEDGKKEEKANATS